MFSGAEIQEARFKNPKHLQPVLICAGLGDIWVGPRRIDFDPRLMAVVQKHLRTHKLPSKPQDQIHWINNRIQSSDWTALETFWAAALEEIEPTPEEGATPATPAEPPTLAELSEADRQAALDAIRKGRAAAQLKPTKENHDR